MYNETLARIGLVTIFLGYNVTFIPQFLLGNMGMPRRYYQYPEVFQNLNLVSTAGAFLLAAGFTLVGAYLLHALLRGKVAGPNPWFSKGYEWQTSSPPDMHNFHEEPIATEGPHDYTRPMPVVATGAAHGV
jgi:cytochrome c oxidase subunit 1